MGGVVLYCRGKAMKRVIKLGRGAVTTDLSVNGTLIILNNLRVAQIRITEHRIFENFIFITLYACPSCI